MKTGLLLTALSFVFVAASDPLTSQATNQTEVVNVKHEEDKAKTEIKPSSDEEEPRYKKDYVSKTDPNKQDLVLEFPSD